MNRHIEAFLEMQVAERGAARNTVLAYAADLEAFRAFAAAAGASPEAADAGLLGAYARSLFDAVAARTAARRLSALRGFFKFLAREGIRADDPSALLDAPQVRPALPKYLAEAEVDALLAAAAGSVIGLAALEMLYSTGLRVSELLGVRRVALAGGTDTLDRARQGRAGTHGAALAAGTCGGGRADRRPPTGHGCSPGRDDAARDDAAGPGAGAQADRARSRARPGARQPARAAAQLRQPHAGARSRPAQPAGVARSCRYRDDADLHACAGRTAAGSRPGAASSALAGIVLWRARIDLGKPRRCVTSWISNGRSPN